MTSQGEGPVLMVPAEGQTVIIECDGARRRAVVGRKAPDGSFSVSWYYGRNRYAPHLPGHWYTEFEADGSPRYEWRIVEIIVDAA